MTALKMSIDTIERKAKRLTKNTLKLQKKTLRKLAKIKKTQEREQRNRKKLCKK